MNRTIFTIAVASACLYSGNFSLGAVAYAAVSVTILAAIYATYDLLGCLAR